MCKSGSGVHFYFEIKFKYLKVLWHNSPAATKPILITQLIPASTSILTSQLLLCLPVYSVGACHASSLWCKNKYIHHSLYCSLFNCSLSSRVCLSSASQPILSPNLICRYFHAVQFSFYLNLLDEIALHPLSCNLWNQFILGILSLILLTFFSFSLYKYFLIVRLFSHI